MCIAGAAAPPAAAAVITLGCPMHAFSSWMLLIHSPPDLITSLLLQKKRDEIRRKHSSICSICEEQRPAQELPANKQVFPHQQPALLWPLLDMADLKLWLTMPKEGCCSCYKQLRTCHIWAALFLVLPDTNYG
jgi:hypothetical protein